MSIRVYAVGEGGAVRPGRRRVFREDRVDIEVAANPMRYPPCRCPRCVGPPRG